MIKRALIVGINYVGTGHELRGCINDANNMKEFFTEQFGFSEIRMLIEKAATTRGILDGLKWLVTGVTPGDVIVFHYSGHGSQIRSTLESDKLDEIICPVDLNWRDKVITDNELKQIFSTVPNGVNVTVILDCCHSGDGLDQEYSYVPVSAETLTTRDFDDGSRYLPMPDNVAAEIEGMPLRTFITSRDVNRSAMLIASCMPAQTAADAFIAGQFQGAGSFSLRRAYANGARTYQQLIESMTGYMVSSGFAQRPQLDGHPSLRNQAFMQPWGTLEGTVSETPPPGTWMEPTPSISSSENTDGADSKTKLLIVGFVVVVLLVVLLVVS
jgi:hypothetical protein